MTISSFTVSLTVQDVPASSQFLVDHFGFVEKMAADGFASLQHEASGTNVVYLRTGIEVLPEGFRHQHAAGVILAFTAPDIEAESRRLQQEGVPLTLPLRTEAWGEKLFQVTDPNGVVIELVEWVTDTSWQ